MSATATISLRIDPDLLAALKARARAEDSTVSGVIVRLVEKEVQPMPRHERRSRTTMGMFPDFDAPNLDELINARRALSRRMRPREIGNKKR